MFEGGRRLGDALLGLHWLPGDGEPRLGLAVSRKVDPRAVGRNRIKRVLRDDFRRRWRVKRMGFRASTLLKRCGINLKAVVLEGAEACGKL